MFTITKDFENLCVSHQLHGLPEGHKCARMHGHNVTVRVVLAAPEVNESGFVVDYGDLAPLKDWLWRFFDHRHLNEVVDFQPSAELMAKYVYEWCVQVKGWPIASVGWSETSATWALYTSSSGIGKIEETPEQRAARVQAAFEAALPQHVRDSLAQADPPLLPGEGFREGVEGWHRP